MKVAILGTRGVPNNHGGFEQFAESLSEYLVEKGHKVTVYNSHNHPYKDKLWKGVNIVHKFDPEYLIGTAGQFIYDLGCILDTRRRGFDVILQLGYTSSSIWNRLFAKKDVIVTNMDGLEWKRSKYGPSTQKFLKYAEGLAIKHSNFLVADSVGIKNYLSETYKVESEYIAYGATLFQNPSEEIISNYGLIKYNYDMLVARLEPENNIDTILEGIAQSKNPRTFLVIGKHETKFGEYLKKKYQKHQFIKFMGGIYNQNHLDNLRYYSNLYFHGHSVGGTNPSLLEAMASGALIVAHENIFNKSILIDNAFYFSNPSDITKVLTVEKEKNKSFIRNNYKAIEEKFSSDYINGSYEKLLMKCSQIN